jgi:hypothetical protein
MYFLPALTDRGERLPCAGSSRASARYSRMASHLLLLQHSYSCSPDTHDEDMSIVNLVSSLPTLAVQRQVRGAGEPVFRYPFRAGNPLIPSEVTSTLTLVVGGLKHCLTAMVS